MKCCICDKPIEKEDANNPFGAVDIFGNLIEWENTDKCCYDCMLKYVLYGRIMRIKQNEKYR